jgi:hypothetical protein
MKELNNMRTREFSVGQVMMMNIMKLDGNIIVMEL